MPLINRLESKLGRFAIPGLVQLIAGLQLLTLFLLYFSRSEAQGAFIESLLFDREKVFQGQVWRMFSFLFVPSTKNLFFALITAWFMMWVGKGLEQAWGAFRVNVFVIGGMLAVAAGAMIFGYATSGVWFFQTFIFAFAMFYPNEEILLMLVLPVKIKWVAWIGAGMMFFTIILQPILIIPIFFANLAFLVAFGPEFVRSRLHMAEVSQRRQRFERAQLPETEAFHKCAQCGKTEHDDRHLEWRVTDDGEEYCSACRPPKDKKA